MAQGKTTKPSRPWSVLSTTLTSGAMYHWKEKQVNNHKDVSPLTVHHEALTLFPGKGSSSIAASQPCMFAKPH